MPRHLRQQGALLATLAFGLIAVPAAAQDFYDGKTVRIIQPFGTGGAFDTVARLVTRHLNKHLPGNADYVVDSMPGAGGLIAMNHLYNRAKPDGLTMGFLFANLLVDEALGSPGVRFESDKFAWLAAPSAATPVCTFTAKSGIGNVDDWRGAATPPKLGSIATGGEIAYSIPKLLAAYADLPSRVIVGHEGGNPALKLAAERGEIDGFCGSLESSSILWGDALADGTVNVVVQLGVEVDPQIPDVPLAKDLATSEEGAALINAAVSGPQRVNRAFAFPPNTPPENIAIIRKALIDTLSDPELVEEAKRLKVNINPVSGEDIEKTVAELRGVSPELLEELKKTLSE